MTGVLYARVGTSWIPVSGSGAGVPAGGVAGDLVVKVSGTDMDVRWGTDAPKLLLSSATTVALASTAHPLQLGATAGLNVAMDRSGVVQARNNGAAATLTLNPFGGNIQLGGDGTVAQQVRIGNDAYLTDVNVAHSMGLKSTTDPTIGTLRLGSGVSMSGTADYIDIQSTHQYFDVNGGIFHWRRMGDFADMMNLDTAGTLNVAGSMSANGNINSNGQVYAGSNAWFRVRGNTGVYWEDWGGGWQMTDAQWMRTYNGASIYAGAGEIRGGTITSTGVVNSAADINMNYPGRLRIYSNADNNHYLQYWSSLPAEIHPASGIGSNGPRLVGYGTIVLSTALNGRNWLFEYGGGSAFGAGSWNVFSSRRIKRNIVSLDPDECLDMVRRWKPVEFSPLDSDDRRDGFIAEEMYEVTPNITTVSAEDNDDVPAGSPNAIGYGEASVRLAGAVQALLTRVEALEGQHA